MNLNSFNNIKLFKLAPCKKFVKCLMLQVIESEISNDFRLFINLKEEQKAFEEDFVKIHTPESLRTCSNGKG